MKNALLIPGLLVALSLAGCQNSLKEVAPQGQAVDADGKKVTTYSAVNIDLQSVLVSEDADDNTTHWAPLAGVTPGVRNLLVTGLRTTPLLTSSGFQTGTVKQLRLVLGTNNTIVLADGTVVALDTPSGATSGLKVKLNSPVTGGVANTVLVSIDPAWQVVARGNGTYGLKPVLEGSIVAGTIYPDGRASGAAAAPAATLVR